jgi:hypothetical protein
LASPPCRRLDDDPQPSAGTFGVTFAAHILNLLAPPGHRFVAVLLDQQRCAVRVMSRSETGMRYSITSSTLSIVEGGEEMARRPLWHLPFLRVSLHHF